MRTAAKHGFLGRTMQKAGNFLLAMPLAAGLMLSGCMNPCFSHNSSTKRINRESDGAAASMVEIEKTAENERPNETVIDLMNETHSLSTERMPNDIYVTRVAAHCLARQHADAYSIESVPFKGERGIYVPTLNIGLYRFADDDNRVKQFGMDEINHEIGHFQPGGESATDEVADDTEFIAETNRYEQPLMAYIIYANSNSEPMDIVRWAYDAGQLGLEAGITSTMIGIDNGDGMLPVDKYHTLVYAVLNETNGDFAETRRRIIGMKEAWQLRDAMEEYLGSFMRSYLITRNSGGNPEVDVRLNLRMLYAREIFRRFGSDAARAYFSANASIIRERRTRGLAYESKDGNISEGLEGLDCEVIKKTRASGDSACDQADAGCRMFNADHFTRNTIKACCISISSMDREHVEFAKEAIDGETSSYFGRDGALMRSDMGWDSVELITISQRRTIPLDQSCR